MSNDLYNGNDGGGGDDFINRRPGSPTGVVSPDHPSGCTCGCLHTFPKAMYRDWRETGSKFTGILQLDAGEEPVMWKLNDPNYLGFRQGASIEDLKGTGHEMTDTEFFCDVRQYNLDPSDREGKDIQDILWDFKDKPVDFDFRDEAGRFDAHYPHGHHSPVTPTGYGNWFIPELRQGDMVKIMAYKYVMGHCVKERLWADVEAVSNAKIVTCCMRNDIEHPLLVGNLDVEGGGGSRSLDPQYQVSANDLVYFPVTCVYGVERGKNWPPTKCAKCGKRAADLTTYIDNDNSRSLSRCGRCKQTAYCSRDCQRSHWKEHKKECVAVEN